MKIQITELQFNGILDMVIVESSEKKVVCNNCNWSWNFSDGGDDPYVCHKCGNDNSTK